MNRRRHHATPPPCFAIVTAQACRQAASQPPGAKSSLDLHVTIRKHVDGRPNVTLHTVIGATADYLPRDLRAIAWQLLAIADDADKHPAGRRTFLPNRRRYFIQ